MLQDHDAQTSAGPRSGHRSPLQLLAYGAAFFYAFGLLFIALALTVWFAADILLLVFASMLLAVFLRSSSKLLSRALPLPVGLSLVLVSLSLILLFSMMAYLMAPSLVTQARQLYDAVPLSLERLYTYLLSYERFHNVVQTLPPLQDMVPEFSKVLGQAQAVFSGVLNLTTKLLLVLFIGLYLAAQPDIYIRGLLRLFSPEKKPRMQAVLQELEQTLTLWLLGKLAGMLVIGTATGMALSLLGVPMASALGLLTGLLNFIPYLGPVLAAIPTLLIAFSKEPMLALYAMLFYIGLQLAESYILTPFVDRRTVSLPPALTITVQVIMGIFFGMLGIMLATPLAAVAYVMINMLYVEDVLGDAPGETQTKAATPLPGGG